MADRFKKSTAGKLNKADGKDQAKPNKNGLADLRKEIVYKDAQEFTFFPK